MKINLTAIILLFSVLSVYSQKRPLDHSVYDSWKSLSKTSISDDGNYLFYMIEPGQGDASLVVRSIADNRETIVPRGQMPSVSSDASYAVFTIKPTFEQTRNAKIKKKKVMPEDSIGYIDLSTMEIVKFPKSKSYKAVTEGEFTFAYETGKKDSTKLVVVRPGILLDTLKNVVSYSFNRTGSKLAVMYKDSACLYTLPSMECMTLLSDRKFYSSPSFNYGGSKMAFLASSDTNVTGNRHCAVFLYEEQWSGRKRNAILTRNVTEIIPQNYVDALPDGFCVTENSDPYFSRTGDKLFLGISKYIPQNDTSIYQFEAASLDIWNYDIYMTPPIQKASLDKLKKQTRLSVIDLSDQSHHIVPLAESETDRILLADAGASDFAVSVDNGSYLIESSWDSNDKSDISIVSLKDGTRKDIFTGLDARVSISPKGNYLLWYSGADSSWYSYRISDGSTKNLTANVDGIFYDDEDDHPSYKQSLGFPVWFENDEAFLLNEKYSVFKFHPDGKYAVDLTLGAASRDSIRYRYRTLVRDTISSALLKAGVKQPVPSKGEVYFTSFDTKSRMNGFAVLDVAKGGIKSSFTAPYTYLNPIKALDADVIAYKKGNFIQSPELCVSSNQWKSEQKLTDLSKQQEEYLWGNISLVSWTAYDGTKLDGLLILPENFDTTASYPMIVYFYERYSDELYAHRKPAPSASTVNWSMFSSQGYVVFIPDIRYRDGHPGECAYNCVCSGCDAMCERYPFINRKKIGIQGQSWGGYQTAYLVTRTDMFAAAGAGAPVGNMTSAYGGIRWSTGLVRAMQYEHGQSRIGKSLWDNGGLDLYIENSPIFHTQNVTTPVLIMHNDADGAVPWYQGIEFFMALRRFHHPAWLLQYNGEEHNLRQWRNKVDLSKRLQQFFDHYLKDEPMPAWMKDGVPMVRKGQYFGL